MTIIEVTYLDTRHFFLRRELANAFVERFAWALGLGIHEFVVTEWEVHV